MIIAGTGHRPNKLGGYYSGNPIQTYVRNETRRILEELKPDSGISGMALGFDQILAEIFVELSIPFIAAVPFVGQEGRWPAASQQHYAKLLSVAKDVVVVCEGGYAAWKMQRRNEWMVEQLEEPEDRLLACWDGSAGGTGNCVSYANEVALLAPAMYIRIDPRNWR